MTQEEIEKLVPEQYKKVYPKWKNVRVTQIVPETFGGTLAVINATNENNNEVDEMCFVFDTGKVQVFTSTEQAAIFLDSRSRFPWYQRVFATSTLSGIVFLLSILLIFVAGLLPSFSDKVTAVLALVVGSAAGFYFGASRSRG